MEPERADMSDDLGASANAEPGSRASTEPCCTVSALPGFDPARMAVLEELQDEWICTIARIADATGSTVPETRRILRKLRADGLAEFGPCYDEDDGSMRGSGYTRSYAGARLLDAAIASAIEARRAAATKIDAVEDESATAESRDAQGPSQ